MKKDIKKVFYSGVVKETVEIVRTHSDRYSYIDVLYENEFNRRLENKQFVIHLYLELSNGKTLVITNRELFDDTRFRKNYDYVLEKQITRFSDLEPGDQLELIIARKRFSKKEELLSVNII